MKTPWHERMEVARSISHVRNTNQAGHQSAFFRILREYWRLYRIYSLDKAFYLSQGCIWHKPFSLLFFSAKTYFLGQWFSPTEGFFQLVRTWINRIFRIPVDKGDKIVYSIKISVPSSLDHASQSCFSSEAWERGKIKKSSGSLFLNYSLTV